MSVITVVRTGGMETGECQCLCMRTSQKVDKRNHNCVFPQNIQLISHKCSVSFSTCELLSPFSSRHNDTNSYISLLLVNTCVLSIQIRLQSLVNH